MKKAVLIIFLLSINQAAELAAQKIITLKECYDLAFANNTLSEEKAAYNGIWQIKDRNLIKSWYPSLDANVSAIYNSEVVDIGSALGSLPVPGLADAIKPLPHEQYRMTVDINQMIYDGGITKNARALEKYDLGINEKQTEAELYKLRGQINNYYFNLLLLNRQKELHIIYLELINKRILSMQSSAENGVVTLSDIDALKAEKIKIEQQLAENAFLKASLLKILSGLTGTEINESTILVLPDQNGKLNKELVRPELQLFDIRKGQLAAGIKVIESKRMPKAFGFATLGYGNPPGNNFFRDEFAPYYILGAGVKWNIFDWNKARDEKQVISLQQGILENRKTDLSDNLNRLMEMKGVEISSLKSLLETDSELIELRKRITAAAESQYENGIITASEYLNQLNAERQAQINLEIHKVNLALKEVEYLNISGNEIE